MADDDLMSRFAGQLRQKKKYRDIPVDGKRETSVPTKSMAVPALNLLHQDLLEEDYTSAIATLNKVVKILGLESQVNFEIDE